MLLALTGMIGLGISDPGATSTSTVPRRQKEGVMTTDARSGRGYEYGGPAFPGGILVGVGLGILLGDFFAWLLIGTGAGFILMGLIAAIARR